MKRYALIQALIVLIFIFFGVYQASADMIEPGKKIIPVFYRVTNLDAYPDYVFLLYTFAPMKRYAVITGGEKFGEYKFSTSTLYAIKASEYRILIVGNTSEDIQKFFDTTPQLISSNLQLSYMGKTVFDRDPLVAQEITLNIILLTSIEFKIQLSSINYFYSDGTVENVPYSNTTPTHIIPSNLPEPLNHRIIWIVYLLIPIGAILGIVLIKKIMKQKGVER